VKKEFRIRPTSSSVLPVVQLFCCGGFDQNGKLLEFSIKVTPNLDIEF
jgi:hypothetical protein